MFKMEVDVPLTNSNFCRLCAEENSNGIDLFTTDENSENLLDLVNNYLPVKIENEDLLPKTICPGCHIQLEATKLFMDLIVEGQLKLHGLLKAEQDRFHREEKERQKLEQALQNHNPKASVETYTIQTDENGEKYIIQIYSEGPLFSPDHQLSLKANKLDKPKKKRGRPKTAALHETFNEPSVSKDDVPNSAPILPTPPVDLDPKQRRKRKIKPPARYAGVFQGKELSKLLKNEGMTDEETDALDDDEFNKGENVSVLPKSSDPPRTAVGKLITGEGEVQVEELVFMKPKPKAKVTKTRRKGSVKQRFACNICKKEFKHYGRCEMHKRSHKLKHSCQDTNCDVQSDNRLTIIEHQKATGHMGITTYEHISKFNGTVLLSGVNEPPDEPISNGACKEEERKSLECEKCAKKFTCKQNYEVHLKAIHDGERPFKCETCEKTFAYACSLKTHMIAHKTSSGISSADYKCDLCAKVFQHPSSLTYHKDTEHGNRRFVCNQCNKSFKHRQLLLRHQSVHSDERPFKCDQCNRQFKSKTNLANHENIHKGVKKFVCPMCGNMFLYKTSLWVHLKWHEGTKPYVCDVCKKAFSQKGNLIEHRRIHTGEKPFACNMCERTFTTSSQCKLHMKRHTGVKPYRCKYCAKHFLNKETFDSHIRRHLGERPFQCKFCTKSFPEQWACTRHERIHLGLKKYKCEVCNKAFSDSANFSKHKKIHLRNVAKLDTLVKQPQEIVIDLATEPPNTNPTLLTVSEEVENEQEQEKPSANLQLHDLMDHEGNTISITTADGQPIPIVSSGDENFQGLLPDGTLVSLDLLSDEQVTPDEEGHRETELTITDTPETNLLNTAEIQFPEEDTISNTGENLSQEKGAFLSENGKVCFINGFDENAFLFC